MAAAAGETAAGAGGQAVAPYLPESFRKLQEVEKKIIQAVELSGETMQELSKMGAADKDTTTQLVKKFLENIRDVKVELNQAILNSPTGFVNRSSDYISKFEAMNAATKVDVVLLYIERMQGIVNGDGLQAGPAAAAAATTVAKEEDVTIVKTEESAVPELKQEEPEAMQVE